jgi:hypothetical protein
MKAAFEHGSQRGQHRAGDSIEAKTGPSQYGPARGRRRVPSGEKKSESSLARWL